MTWPRAGGIVNKKKTKRKKTIHYVNKTTVNGDGTYELKNIKMRNTALNTEK